MTVDTTVMNEALGFIPNWELAGLLVGVVILAIGMVRGAFPTLLPPRMIPLFTWISCSILYPLFEGFTREDLLAGLVCGIVATGTHAGLRATLDPQKKVASKMSKIRNQFGKLSQTNKNL